MNSNVYLSFPQLVSRSRQPALQARGADGASVLYSYAQLDILAGKFAAALRHEGCQPGDRIASQVPKSVMALALYLACLKGGFAFVPMNTAYRENETRHLLLDASPKLVVAAPELAAQAQKLRPDAVVHTLDADGLGSLSDLAQTLDPDDTLACDPEALAILLYTSGTTGLPKGAMLSHRSLEFNARALTRRWSMTPQDTVLHCLPLFHAHGLTVSSNCILYAGARFLWLDKFDAETVLDELPHSSVFMGVPTMYARLLASKRLNAEACSTIRLFLSGSAPLGAEITEGFRRRTGVAIAERYGMSETGINASPWAGGTVKAGSVGPAMDGAQIRIMGPGQVPAATGEPGEVQISSPSLCSGYWQRPDATAESFRDGWFATGDVGRLDEEGHLFLINRIKDIIISGGYNVYPAEVEAAIEELPGIEEVAVVGVPHPDFGEGVIAVLRGDERFDEDAAVRFLKTRIANYKVPKKIFRVTALPRNTIGKVMRNELRDQYRELFQSVPKGAST